MCALREGEQSATTKRFASGSARIHTESLASIESGPCFLLLYEIDRSLEG
jgi:hypothetical protein